MEINLSDIASIKTGLALIRKKADLEDKNLHYKVVSLKSFNQDAIYDDVFADDFVANEKLKDDYLVKKGDILLRLREPFFAVYIDKDYENLIFSSLMLQIKIEDENFNSQFVAYYLNSQSVKKQLSKGAISGTTILMISLVDVKNIKIPLISLDKQIKISKYLSLAYKEKKLLKTLIIEKEKHTKSIIEKILKGK